MKAHTLTDTETHLCTLKVFQYQKRTVLTFSKHFFLKLYNYITMQNDQLPINYIILKNLFLDILDGMF